MSLDMTSFDAALKEHYTDEKVENLVYKDNPLLAMLSKMEEFGGANLPIPLIHGNPVNRSATFSVAQGGTTTSLVKAFTLTRVNDYSIATIDNETIEASKGNANAFMEAATTEIDGAINSLTRSLAIALYRSGYGEIGQIASSSGISGATITLSNPSDAHNFEVGQVCVFSSSLNGATLRNSGTGLTVLSVDRSAGTVTFSANVSTETGTSNSDYVFIKGDRQNSASPSRLKVAGLEAWCPRSAPSASESFFGVDRSVDSARLAGLRVDGTAMSLEEALIEGAVQSAALGNKIDHCFMSFDTFGDLEKSLGSKVQYTDLKMNAEIGFRGLVVNGPRGPIKVIPDQNCPSNRVWMMELSAVKLYSLGKAVRVIDTDGLKMLRQASADGVEVRYGFRGNLGVRKPSAVVNILV